MFNCIAIQWSAGGVQNCIAIQCSGLRTVLQYSLLYCRRRLGRLELYRNTLRCIATVEQSQGWTVLRYSAQPSHDMATEARRHRAGRAAGEWHGSRREVLGRAGRRAHGARRMQARGGGWKRRRQVCGRGLMRRAQQAGGRGARPGVLLGY